MIFKHNLLNNYNFFIDNEYLDKYIELINTNLDTKKERFKTQCHHIIPRCWFVYNNLEVDNSKNNEVNLLYRDHILAHYYLALCSEGKIKNSMILSIKHILGKIKQDHIELDFDVNKLERYQELYEYSKEYFGKKIKGSHHTTSQETKNKIGKANRGKVYINKDGIVKTIQPDELDSYLINGWIKGNPNASKRDFKKGNTIVHKENIEKYIPKEELKSYLDAGWVKGRTKEHSESTKKGTIKYYSTLTKEEIKKKCTSQGMLGKKQSEEAKKKISLALKGRKQSEEQKLKNSLDKKGTIHMTNGIINKMVKPELEQELLIQGFWRGRTIKKRNNNK